MVKGVSLKSYGQFFVGIDAFGEVWIDPEDCSVHPTSIWDGSPQMADINNILLENKEFIMQEIAILRMK